ncbi:MAG: hypothetical protein WC489_04250 [Patescibacteria group bacterium]
MFEVPIRKKALVFSAFFSFLIVAVIFCTSYFSEKNKVVFCDVGQGDGAYIRIRNSVDLIIDAGPANNQMLRCLGAHMPFYDRQIEYVIISHLQTDHYGGMLEVLKRYRIRTVFLLPFEDTKKQTKILEKALHSRNTQIIHPVSGDSLSVLDAQILFVSPSKKRLNLPKKDKNDLSIVVDFRFPADRFLFTGDISASVLDGIGLQSFTGSSILKIPHHGSKYGLSSQSLINIDPQIAVISAGSNNSYGHPAKEILDMLEMHGVLIRRTDVEGDIVFSF